MIRVHSYESMGTVDGPGLRLVVFLQGCNFRCLYCANVDTIDLKGDAREVEPKEIVDMALRQKPYFGKRGGVTFSGGEALLQARELIPLFRELKANGIHIALDTNGSIWNEGVCELLTMTDLVLLDVKHFNDLRHRELTGLGNANTLKFAQHLQGEGIPFWLRYVLVPTLTSQSEDIEAMCEYFKDYSSIEKVELLPYHRLGEHKYENLGVPYRLKGLRTNTNEEIQAAREIFERHFDSVWVNQ